MHGRRQTSAGISGAAKASRAADRRLRVPAQSREMTRENSAAIGRPAPAKARRMRARSIANPDSASRPLGCGHSGAPGQGAALETAHWHASAAPRARERGRATGLAPSASWHWPECCARAAGRPPTGEARSSWNLPPAPAGSWWPCPRSTGLGESAAPNPTACAGTLWTRRATARPGACRSATAPCRHAIGQARPRTTCGGALRAASA